MQIGLGQHHRVEFRRKIYKSTIEKQLNSDAENTVAQTECDAAFFLTSTYALMYHREVRVFPQEYHGRLLKLVDRTDLGSVGASHESSSLSPPTLIMITDCVVFVR